MSASSSLFRLVFFFGFWCTGRLADCLTISAVYGQNDVEFTCMISPYTGSQRWYIDSDIVALCGAVSCSEEPTNPARYSFTPNVSSGIFIFKIDYINSTDVNTKVGCFNGTNTELLLINFPVVEDGTSDGFCSTTDGECKVFIFWCITFFILWLIGLIRCCCNCCCNETRSKKDDIIKCINVLLCIPILGVIVVIYSFLHRKTCNLDPPDPPINFAKIRSTDTTITVQWKEGSDNGYKQTFYVYINEDKYKVDSTCTDGAIWSYTFKGLKSDTNYRIKIKAKSCMGSSEDSLDCRTEGAQAIIQYGGLVGEE